MSQTTKSQPRKSLDPAGTRRKIIDAAFSIFSEHGYGATSIGEVAAKAGVQKSLVQYHFGNKEELWQACLADRAEPVVQEMDKFLSGQTKDPSDLIEARFNMLKRNPELRKALAWASMETVPLPRFIEERRAQLFGALSADPDGPKFSKVLLALAAMDGWFTFGNLYKRVLGDQMDPDELEQTLLKQIKKVVSKK